MAVPLAVVTADLHQAPRAWVKHPSLEGDSYYGLEQVIDHCVTNYLPLIMAGDVFDKTRPDPKTIHVMSAQLDRMEAERLAVYYIQGQHELDRLHPWLNAIHRWPTHVHKKAFQIGLGPLMYGLDWMPADAVQAEFDAIPERTDVLVAHQVWRDLMGPRIGESECAFSDVPHVKMIITGDFHRHLLLDSLNRACKSTKVLSPGPLCMQSIDENPSKEFFILKDDLSVYSVALRTRQCFRFMINTKEDLEIFLTGNVENAVRLQTGVPDNISKNIVHVSYEDSIPEAYQRLTNALQGKVHLFLVPVRHKHEAVTVEAEKRRSLADGGLEACLELAIDKGSPLYRDLNTLLRSPDPVAQLEEMHRAFINQRSSK